LSGLQKVMSDLTQLNYLGLSSMSYAVPDLTTVEMGMFIDHISSLPNLEHLKLSNNPKIVTIRESIGSLRKLRNLDISACKNLERLPECMVKMNSLMILFVEGCYNLVKSTFNESHTSLACHWVMPIPQYLPNIVEIWMCDLPKCNRLPPIGQLPNLKELHI
jgi:hypothetical protein